MEAGQGRGARYEVESRKFEIRFPPPVAREL